VINVHGRQVFHLVSGEAELDKEGPDLSHSADRDSHFLVAPHVPLLEEHVGYMVAARFHDQPLDLPYLAVGRQDGQSAVYLYLAGWDGVDGDLLRGFRFGGDADRPDYAPSQAILRLFPWMRVPGGVEVRYDLGLLGGSERLELR
jgi:hypothetical protein